MNKYQNREHAGTILAAELKDYKAAKDTIILALPRGGVPVAYAIAKSLELPLDIIVVRKLGVPWHEELAMGAITSGGGRVLNQDIIKRLKISDADINLIQQQEQNELERRIRTYRGNSPLPELAHKTIILVDDGIATGATIKAAIAAIKQQKPKYIIVAVPVAPQDTINAIKPTVNKLICPLVPDYFDAVGIWYEQFGQTTDDEVITILKKDL